MRLCAVGALVDLLPDRRIEPTVAFGKTADPQIAVLTRYASSRNGGKIDTCEETVTCSRCVATRLVEEVPVRALSLAAALTRGCGRPPREHHLSLNHHCGKLPIGAVYRGLQDDRAPPHMDRYGNASKPPRHAGTKDIRLRLDRGCPKSRQDVEPGNAPPRSSANAASAPP